MDIETVVVSKGAALRGVDLLRNSSETFSMNIINDCDRRGLVIADSGIKDADLLLDQLEPGTDLWRVDPQSDVKATLLGALSGGYGALHFLGHGHEGRITLGNRVLEVEDFTELSCGKEGVQAPSLHFWSCMTGAGAKGRAFVDGISRAFGAAVTAFSGFVGAESQGGSWLPDVFSRQSGSVLSPFVNSLAYPHTLVSSALLLKSTVTETGIDVQVWLKAGTVIDSADLYLTYDIAKADYTGSVDNVAVTGLSLTANEESSGFIAIAGYCSDFTPISSDVDLLLETISFTSVGSDSFSVELTSDSSLTNNNENVILGTLPAISYEFSVDNISVDIAENHLAGEISGADADVTAAGTVTFSLVEEPKNGSGAALFSIDSTTGQISLTSAGASTIDFDSETQSYKLAVQATDGATWVDERSITVNLTNVNDNSPELSVDNSSVDLAENASSGEISGAKASATDADGDTVTFSLVDPPLNDTSEALFTIDASTGQISLTEAGALAIDYELTPSYTLTVKSSDGLESHDQTSTVTVNLTNINDNAPELTVEHESVNLAEDAVSGDISGAKASAEDADDDTLTFSLVDPPLNDTSEALFTIDASTGQISLTEAGAAAIDYESDTKSYTLTIKASDDLESHDKTSTVTIDLTNVNDNSPELSVDNSSVDLAENASLGEIVGAKASVTDADGDTVTFSLVDVPTKEAEALFSIDSSTGQISLTEAGAAVIDYESETKSYTLTVKASDGLADHDQTSTVTVNLTNVNDNSPIFTSSSTGSVDQDAPAGTIIYEAVTTDADNLDERTYSLSGTDAELLDITPEGVVTLKDPANYATQASYSFDVVASDGDHETIQEVVISVNPPDVVTNTDDSGSGSLRAAIEYVNVYGTEESSNTITFDVSGTILVDIKNPLPVITRPVSFVMGENTVEIRLENAPVIEGIAIPALSADNKIEILIPANLTITSEGSSNVIAVGSSGDLVTGEIAGTLHASAVAEGEDYSEAIGMGAGGDIHINGDLSGTVTVEARDNAIGLGAADNDLQIVGNVSGTVTVTASAGEAYGIVAADHLTIEGAVAETAFIEVTGSLFAVGIGGMGGDLDINGGVAGTITVVASEGKAYGLGSETSNVNIGGFSGELEVRGNTFAGGIVAGFIPDESKLSEDAYGNVNIDGDFSGNVAAYASGGNAYGIYAGQNTAFAEIPEGTVSGTIVVTGELSGAVSAISEGTDPENPDAEFNAFGVYAYGDLTLGTMSGTVTATALQGDAGGIVSEKGDLIVHGDLSGEVTASTSNGTAYGVEADNDMLIKGSVSGSVTSTSDAGEAYGILAQNNLTIEVDVADTAVIEVTGSEVAVGFGASTGGLSITGAMAGTVTVLSSGADAYGFGSQQNDVCLGSYTGAVTATGQTLVIGIGAGVDSFKNIDSPEYVASDFGNLTIYGDFSGQVAVTSSFGYAFGVVAANTLTIEGDVTETAAITVTVLQDSPDDGVAIGAMNDLVINGDMAGTVTVTATEANGIVSENGSVTFGSLSGTIEVDGDTFAEGIAAQSVLINGPLSGAIIVDASNSDAFGIDAQFGDILVGGGLSGTVTVTANELAYGLRGAEHIGISSLSGTVSASSECNGAFGLRSKGAIDGGTPEQALEISGTVSAEGSTTAAAISAGGAMNLSISGTVSGTTTNPEGTAWSILSLHYDGDGLFSSPDVIDRVTVTGSGSLTGNVDLGAGNDIMTLEDGANVSGVATLDGGEGIDTLALSGSVIIDMSLLSSKVRNFEIIDLSDGSDNQISLASSDVGLITDFNHDLYIRGDSHDHVELRFVHYAGTSFYDSFQYVENLNIDGFEYAYYTGEYIINQTSGESQGIYLYVQLDMQVTEFLPWVQNGTDNGDTLKGTWDDDLLYGKGGNDSMTGEDGNDTLDGGEGNDTMKGGAGDDLYMVDSTGDMVIENSNEGIDTVQSSISYTLAANVENLILTGSDNINGTGNTLNNILTGNSGNNILSGGAGNDTLDGGEGSDTMQGGVGNDTYVVDSSSDVVTEVASAGIDTVQSSVTYTLAANVENLELTGTDDNNGTGNTLDNQLLGNSGNNVLSGGTGNDTLDGGEGSDTMQGGVGNDTYVVDSSSDVVTETAGAGTDTVQSSITWSLAANVENLLLTGTEDNNGTGNTLANLLIGNSGNNTLDGGVGIDSMRGGDGDDTYVVDNLSDAITENLNEGNDTVRSSVTYTLAANIENLTLTGTAASNGTGNTLDNQLVGNSANNVLSGGVGNDTLDGGAGNDTMQGGAGNDTYVVNILTDVVTETAGAGTDTVQSSVTYTLAVNVENLTLTGGTAAINGTGNTLNNLLIGNSGNNTLDGGVGIDSMQGGDGNDTYVVDNLSDAITENLDEGTDTVRSSVTWTLAANIENLTLTGTTAINGTGNTLANLLIGNSGNNTLAGGAGDDTMQGGVGNDTYLVDSSSDVVTEVASAGTDSVQSSVTYTLGVNIENLTLTGTSDLDGTGNTLANLLVGNDGDNILDGAGGNDTMQGGLGNDTYVVDSSSDVVTEATGAGTSDTVQSSVTYTLTANVENLELTGTTAINGTGNTLNNLLIGNSGNNTLDGGIGIDSMQGGSGDDTYIVDNISDVITENLNEGTDTVRSSATYTLADNIENLTLTGTTAMNGTGNSLNNIITGNTGNNVLTGGAGNDTLDGGAGNDTMRGGLDNDTYVVDSSSDVIIENFDEGTDTVRSSFTYTLSADIENLMLTGTTAINGTGNTLNNMLVGTIGNNTLDGGAGDDTMKGGLGNDTYVVDSSSDVVTEAASEGTDIVRSSVTYTLGVNIENLTLTGSSDLDGTGNTLANLLVGNDGDNILDGAGGNDTMQGGLGNDTYVVDSSTDVVTEATGAGTSDTVQSSITYTLAANVENLTLTGGTAAINGTGNTLNNLLIGNSGNNTLDGGVGIDSMQGGSGDDTYVVDNLSDAITENLNEGTDTVRSSATYTLADNIENLTLTGTTAIHGTGNDLHNLVTGNTGNNSLSGGAGNDTLDGGAGNDTMRGGLDNDTYVVDSSSDVIIENFDEGTDTVRSSFTYTLSADIENLMLTGTAAINGTGNALDNLLVGNSGNNTLDGGAGDDTMQGGLGNDTYVVDSSSDVVTEVASEGTDIVRSSVTYTLGDNIENLTLIGTAAINGTGNTLNNILAGNSGDNILYGAGGNDTMQGGLGNDTYVVDSSTDIVTEAASAGIDTVHSSITYTLGLNVENLELMESTAAINGTGNTLNNLLIGNSGNNTLDGGVGIDTMQGGDGNDTYVVDSSSDVITENLDEGTDTVRSSFTYTLSANIENLTLTGTTAINGTGNDVDNILTGNTGKNILIGALGNDTLDGGAGIDTMQGGDGNDTYVVDSSSDVVTESADQGIDTVRSSVTYTLGVNIENLTLTGTAAINGTGNSLNNIITGNTGNNVLTGADGNDTLDGGGGNDTMQGGLGNDTYIVDSSSDVVTEATGAGTDTVQSSVTYTLAANVENLTLTGGTAAINGTGNTLNNLLTGNSGNNTLDGGVGNDTMLGGLGNDTYVVDSSSDVITENLDEGTDTVRSSFTYTLKDNFENLTLTGTTAINGTGNDVDNLVTGNTGNNSLSGGLGKDTLDGGAGNDTMQGGDGDDIYVVDSSSDVIIENSDQGTDTVLSSFTYTLAADIENLTLTGTTAINGTGNALNNMLVGNSGNNTLDGGAGNDTMQGGSGNNTYVVNSTDDVVTEAASAGTDSVQSSFTYTLGANIENLTLTGTTDLNGTGNTLNNILAGNSGDNILDGGVGNDTMQGGGGDDTYVVDSSTDIVTEAASAGIDTVQSSVTYTLAANVENLMLTGTAAINGTGNTLNNLLTGNSGNNTLDGGVGSDTMQGGLGNDTYVVDSSSDVIIENLDEGTDTVRSSFTYVLADNIENLTLTGATAINGTGNDADNILTGNTGKNILIGALGNDTLDGGAGIDTMQGGDGNDTYVVDSSTDVVTEATSPGIDTVRSSVTYTLGVNIENLTLTGTAAINGTGNSLNNIITGNTGNNVLTGADGNDTLDGGGGNDTMLGGLGNDTYVVDSSTDVVTEATSPGIDTVLSSVTYTLGANIENLMLMGTAAINGTGNALDNILTGNSGNNILDGGAGTDSLNGGEGSDFYVVSLAAHHPAAEFNDTGLSGTDEVRFTSTTASTLTLSAGDTGIEKVVIGTAALVAVTTGTTALNVDASAVANALWIIGNAGANSLTGTGSNDTLDGGAGNDNLIGGDGNDNLIGGNGNDTLTGGNGNDHFVFNFAPNAATNRDTIIDFVPGTDDLQFSRAVFTTLGLVGDLSPSAFWSSDIAPVAQDGADRIIYNGATGALYYDADGTGATAAVQVAIIGTATHPVLQYTDIHIIA